MSSSRNNLDEELAQNIAIGDEPGIEVIPFSDGPEVRPTEFGPSLGIQVIRTGQLPHPKVEPRKMLFP